ncbi:VOC family protein [Ectobacillus sp. JY-23]|uniref:VOC family protein n=1 Tax=Ectobacillus sp. JY-23 TaxID=2933872 RepID=UPI001FF5CB10|nr:VOC family protein [Ectobacillus sp. JY-23]UOY92230.1 VOC family protein [Ectobacillus sp. JY-23]
MHPVLNQIGTVFIPVRNIRDARDWYCDLLGLPADGEILFGHLYIVPMKGTSIVLDSKIYAEEHVFKIPPFHLNTDDIEQSYTYMKSKNIEITTNIEHNHWFQFKDPDGNHLMICKC